MLHAHSIKIRLALDWSWVELSRVELSVKWSCSCHTSTTGLKLEAHATSCQPNLHSSRASGNVRNAFVWLVVSSPASCRFSRAPSAERRAADDNCSEQPLGRLGAPLVALQMACNVVSVTGRASGCIQHTSLRVCILCTPLSTHSACDCASV